MVERSDCPRALEDYELGSTLEQPFPSNTGDEGKCQERPNVMRRKKVKTDKGGRRDLNEGGGVEELRVGALQKENIGRMEE